MSERIKTSLIIFFLLSLYLVGLNDRGMFHDGYLYAAFGKHALTLDKWLIPHLSNSTYSEFFHHTPFLFIFEGVFFKIFGVSYASARLFVLFFLFITAFYFFSFLKKEKKHIHALVWIVLFLTLPPLLKKSRFPNIDLPLMLFTTLSLVEAYKAIIYEKVNRWWSSGLFFGLALLTKGPLAFHIALVLFLFIAFEKRWSLLKQWRVWAGFSLGLLMFGLWPLSLKIYGRIDIFYQWINFIFVESIMQGRGERSPFITYFKFLAINAPLWSILLLIGFYKIKKKTIQLDSLYRFSLIWFLSLIIPLSFMGLKYSNYLIPLYPAFALLSLYPIINISELKEKAIVNWSLPLIALGLIGSLVFSQVYKSHRDQVLYEAIDYARENNLPTKNWILYNNCYPFFSLQNLLAFEESASVFQIENVTQFDKDALVIIHRSDVEKIAGIKKLIDLSSKDLVLACSNAVCPK